MIKKISILTLLLLFFVSTTGLPLTIHFCNMAESMGKMDMATCACHMHNSDRMHKACSLFKVDTKRVSVKSQNCCDSEISFVKHIKDSFLSNKTEIRKELSTQEILVTAIPVIQQSQDFSYYTYADTSPPPLLHNQIYIFNSVFLI